MAFLDDLEPRPLTQGKLPEGCKPLQYFLTDKSAAEVAVFQFNRRPTQAAVRECWKEREKGRAVPVLAAFLHGSYATLCGPVITHSTGQPPIYFDLPVERAQTVCREFLSQPNNEAAVKFVREALPQMVSAVPGLRNEGMFSSHYLHERVSGTAHYTPASQKAAAVVNLRERQLLQGLGFEIEETNQNYLLLKTGGRKQAVAVLVREDEMPDRPAARFADLSPAAYALNKAQDNGCPWVVTMQGDKLRLYSTDGERPVASKGRTETFAEINLALIEEQHQPFLWLLFSADALRPDGTVDYILNESSRFAVDVRVKLRDRIYTAVIPKLAQGLAAARGLKRMNAAQLRETYDAALVLLFRLLFVAYAEDKDLLPYLESQAYRKKSLKGLAQDLVEERLKNAAYHKDTGTGTWKDVQRVFHAIREGDKALSVPAYNGGLFDKDRPEGKIIDSVELPDSVFRAALSTLLVDDTRDGIPGPVDFSAIGVREFGTIYEGLLLSELGQAEEDLASDAEGRYRPVSKKTDIVVVAKGEFYLHNASGARKASGSYYTPEFAVAHLLKGALNPALDEHFQRLDQLPEAEAGKRFFDFRVSDIAMGSGHFLVSAVDFIEAGMSRYLERRPLPAVKAELESLRQAAEAGLAQVGVQRRVDGSQLLRRMIARRCIYGVDYNRTAVELARLALWIHTFVPGLPLSFLDRTLRHGNSLAGIERVQEAEDLLKQGGFGFTGELKKYLKLVAEDLEKLRALTDSSVQDINRAKMLEQQVQHKLAPAKAMFDVLTAARLDDECQKAVEGGELSLLLGKGDAAIPGSKLHRQALEALEGLHVLHFPIAFPEVFFGDNPGFDVMLGNPPWEAPKPEERAFWARFMPGLRAYAQAQQLPIIKRFRQERPDLLRRFEAEEAAAERMRDILSSGAFPGMGRGDPDLYKGFCWRFWRLCRIAGSVGVVLPRSVWCTGGSEEFRKAVLAEGSVEELTFVLNSARWMFDMEPRYTVALSVLRRAPSTTVRFRGPYSSLDRFRAAIQAPLPAVSVQDFLSWTPTAVVPLLQAEESLEAFLQLRKAPNLGLNDPNSWRARPYDELHSSNDKYFDPETKQKPLMHFVDKQPKGFVPVYKGESFDLWSPDEGPKNYYGWADPDKVVPYLQEKRKAGGRNRRSAFSEFDARYLADVRTLPFFRARIARRKMSRSTDSRTVRVALIPPGVLVADHGATLLWPRGDEKDEAYLLGVLSSIPLDWYARCIVEGNVTFEFLNAFPIPRPKRDNPLWQRVVALAGRLAAVDDRYTDWARAVGVEHGPLDDRTRQDHIHELDAAVALLYGLTEQHLTHIFETFHEGTIEGQPYTDRLTPVLAHYRRLKG